jgi:SET domain-containing protein
VKASLIAGAGKGLYATRKIKENKKIGRYRGVYYRHRSAGDTVPESHKPYLMDTVDGGVIDGYRFNNNMRWVNHSTTPNAYAHLENDGIVFFKALRDIEQGEEIYIDYGYDPTVPDKPAKRVRRCEKCGSAGVRGAIIFADATPDQRVDLYCLVCIPTHAI